MTHSCPTRRPSDLRASHREPRASSAPTRIASFLKFSAFWTMKPPITPWPAPIILLGMAARRNEFRRLLRVPIDSEQTVTVLGLGYIGLPTAALIARSGNKVTGVDVSQRVVDTVNNGKVHIEEVDLDGLVQGVVTRGTLVASPEVAPPY